MSLITERDITLLRDLVLSHALSRDQFISLGYFGSVTRCNARLKTLKDLRLVRRIETPFFAQHLYAAGPAAPGFVGDRLAGLAASRTGSPRFLQHALSVTNVRVALTGSGSARWRFEQQLRAGFRWSGKDWEVRPDGMAVGPSGLIAVEVDLGHVAAEKFRSKLRAYEAFAASEACEPAWGAPTFELLVVTTSERRARHLSRLLPHRPGFGLRCESCSTIGARFPGSWS